MAAAFGLHFGGSSACLAVYKDGKTDVVANDAGDRTTPAVVAFTDHDQAVGLAAKQGMIRNAINTVCNVKQVLGRPYDDPLVQATANSNSYAKLVNQEGEVAYEVDYKEVTKTFSAKQIATLIFKKMMDTAQSHGEGDIHDVVLTVPIDYSQAQRDALSSAAAGAGFNVLRVITEPAAAVLAYDIGQNDIHQHSNVLVFRLGGTSMDVTVMSVTGGMYRILSSVADASFGGKDFTNHIISHFADEFKRKWKADMRENKRAVAKLRNASELCKHILSNMTTAGCSVDSLYDGIDFQSKIARGIFEGVSNSTMKKCLVPVDMALRDAKLTKEDIHQVVICGGSTKMPNLQKLLKEQFSKAEFLNSIPQDEVIAIGGAKQAAILTGNEEETKRNEQDVNLPCLAHAIVAKLGKDVTDCTTIFYAKSPAPCRRQMKYSLAEHQTTTCVQIFEERCDEENILLGQVYLSDLPAAAEVTSVFHAKSDGSLHVTCSEASSGTSQDILIVTS